MCTTTRRWAFSRLTNGRVDDGLTAPSNDFVFPLVTGGSGRPIFFASVDVKLAKKGTWTLDSAT